MSDPNLLVNAQHITNTRALSNRRCAIPQPEKLMRDKEHHGLLLANAFETGVPSSRCSFSFSGNTSCPLYVCLAGVVSCQEIAAA